MPQLYMDWRHDEESREPVKRISMYVFSIVLTFAVTAMLARVAGHHFHFVGSAVRNPTGAALRDGLFQGRLDADRGRKQHPESCPPRAPCSVEAMLIVFRPSLPTITAFFIADKVLASDTAK